MCPSVQCGEGFTGGCHPRHGVKTSLHRSVDDGCRTVGSQDEARARIRNGIHLHGSEHGPCPHDRMGTHVVSQSLNAEQGLWRIEWHLKHTKARLDQRIGHSQHFVRLYAPQDGDQRGLVKGSSDGVQCAHVQAPIMPEASAIKRWPTSVACSGARRVDIPNTEKAIS